MAAQAEAAKVTMAFDQDEFFACARYGELDELKKELDKGADVNGKGPGGLTALHAACANGHEAIVKELLARGADTTLANDAGNTPAHYAAQQKQAACLKLVLTDSLKKNNFGRSALTEAIASGDGACATIALEHDSAAEEKIIEGLEKVDTDDAPQTITHSLKLGEKPIRVRELPIADKSTDALGDGSGATDRTGLGVWAAAVVLGRWLSTQSSDFDNKRVVELGAGCGVGALALASSNKSCSVVATDASQEALENCRHNADLFEADFGNPDVSDGPLKQTKRISVQALDWDSPVEPVCGRPAPPLTADPDLFRESGAMFAAGYDRGAGKAREHCDIVVGADLVYSADVVEKLCKTIVALGCSRVYYCAPATGRAGSSEFVERLEKLGFDRHTIDAPSAYSEAPCDEAALYFPDLAQSKFKLHTFVRQEPASPSYQAMAYLIREDLKSGKLERGGSGKRASLPKELRKPTMMPKGVKREKAGIPDDPSEQLPPRRYPHNPLEDDTPASIKRRERELLDDAVRKTGLPVAGEPVPACSGAGAFGYSSSKAKK
jgi:predicted nicotinamide N-methyase